MILEELNLCNFRVFQGEHSFDLAPRTKYKKKRPIILYGGLNGAGKTTILTAVRLVLYGKQSLGSVVSQKNYEKYLSQSIHKSRNSADQAFESEIKLTFSYAHMGIVRHYTVKREWTVGEKNLSETLQILEDEKELSELSYDQCQAFLNELIPIGVSDLFFFDGEKIAELAEDKSGAALGHSIKKLLGLDLIEKLNADLATILRNQVKATSSMKIKKEIEKLENELRSLERQAEEELKNYETARHGTQEAELILSRLETDLSSAGGAWAVSRQSEMANQVRLEAQKDILERSLTDALAGNYPISLARSFVIKTLNQLKLESEHKKNADISVVLKKHVSVIDKKLKSVLTAAQIKKVSGVIDRELDKLLNPEEGAEILHDISDSALAAIEAIVSDAMGDCSFRVKALGKELVSVTDKLERVESNITRAPEDDQIRPALERISKQQEKRARHFVDQNRFLDEYKRNIREAIVVARKLDKLSESTSSDEQSERARRYVVSSRSLLIDFAQEMAARKVKDLEREFIASLRKLSRKEDLIFGAKIDPINFSVKLLGKDGSELDRNYLSAGEKQIYAIAILEALARTSGRKLPIIIDTPLGRLDSVHRANLIDKYFPYASHQVIILSTDTEVDKAYYDKFSKHISHAYKLEYFPSTGSTTGCEGYFWKSKLGEVVG